MFLFKYNNQEANKVSDFLIVDTQKPRGSRQDSDFQFLIITSVFI